MNKGLEALKRIKSHYNDRVCIDILEDFDIIEKELKEHEQYKAIEEKIGCPLEVLLQVFRKGIWVKNDCTKNKIEHWCAQDIKVIDAGWQWDICKIRTTCNKYVGCFNYGKTWALTKEELL